MQKYPIIVLVGPSGAGKTALLLEMLKRYPNLCAPIKSKTTRTRRNHLDDIFYDFVSPSEFENLTLEGRLFQRVTFANQAYGCDRTQTNAIVANKLGLVVLVQQAVADFRNAGYRLCLIEIAPDGHTPRTDAKRQADDQDRAKIVLNYDASIVNSFAPGGFLKAANELAAIIERIQAST